MRQYIGISRDHSISMGSLTQAAMKDYNQTVDSIKEASKTNNIETIVSIVECGRPPSFANTGLPYDPWVQRQRAIVRRDIVNIDVDKLPTLTRYVADGSATPLFDSIGELIEILEKQDTGYLSDTFLVMAITDGEENASQVWNAAKLTKKIQALQATDRWTFVFRCPQGYKRNFTRLGIPDGNILEWELTERGVEHATTVTTSSFDSYYVSKARGATFTNKFFADTAAIPVTKVKSQLIDVSSKIDRRHVYDQDDGKTIRDFYEMLFGQGTYVAGICYYELTKTEDVQENKKLIILNKETNAMYTGKNARELLDLPETGTIKLAPGKLGKYKVFVQSTSFTRKVYTGTTVLIYK